MSLPEYPATFSELEAALRSAVRHYGASAYNLFVHVPELVRLMCPPTHDGGQIVPECALEAEQLIRTGIDAVSGHNKEAGHALTIIIGLKSDASERRILCTCREEAARLMDVSPETFRKAYEDEFIRMLAFELWRIQRDRYADHT